MTQITDLGRQDPNCTAQWHGTYGAYQTAKCRCPHARNARRLYGKRIREHRHTSNLVDGTGTRRRLQALNAIGWDWHTLGARLSRGTSCVHAWATGDGNVHRTTRNLVAHLYRNLAGVPGPSDRARKAAARNGWLSPAWWDNIDDPNECPTPPMVTAGETLNQRRARHADRYARFLELRAAGHGSTVIRRELGNINSIIYRQLVERHQAEQHATAEVAA